MAFAALKGEKNLAQLASEHDVHVTQIETWRNQLKQNMASLFDTGIEQGKDQQAEVKAHRIYRYLLADLAINRSNQV